MKVGVGERSRLGGQLEQRRRGRNEYVLGHWKGPPKPRVCEAGEWPAMEGPACAQAVLVPQPWSWQHEGQHGAHGRWSDLDREGEAGRRMLGGTG